MLFCGTGSRTFRVGGGSYTIDLTGGSMPPRWMTDPGPGPNAPAADPNAPVLPDGAGSSFKYYTVLSLGSVPAAYGARVTLNYDTCAVGTSGTGPSALGSDLDLWLCNDSAMKCFSSRSFNNNWEGFDTADYGDIQNAGTWVVRVGYDTSRSPGCADTPHSEKIGVAAVWAPASAFRYYPN